MTDNKALVSIGMPVYNSERHLRQALDSVLEQDYSEFELVISDNASTDGTRDICLEYTANDKRIRYYRNERNMGMTWNMNRVFELATGEYFKWAGSHDVIAPSFISVCKQILDRSSHVVLAYPLAQAIDERGEVVKEIIPETIDTRGLPRSIRLFMVIAKPHSYAVINYGLYRSSALRRCRPVTTVIGNDQVTLMEISVLGAIAVVPQFMFFRRYFGAKLTDAETIATDLIRMNPVIKNRRKVRPIWELGIQNVIGAYRMASLKRLYLVPVVAYAFYSRWHRELRNELRHPYSLQQRPVPDY
jgi:glycosyltransferase involved in cell wall biosynthesis